MGKDKERKNSKFLDELNEYYMARKRHNSSFSKVPCPQNFIPGATKARMPNVKLARTVSRKISSVCYQGVLVRMKDNLTVVEKGLVPAGLLGLSVPTPSQHTSCLEHELERIRKKQSRRTIQSLSGIAEATPSDEIGKEEDESILEAIRFKQRGFSLPVTRGDVKLLPVEDPALSGLCRDHKLRRSSYPLNKEEFDEYQPNVHHNESNTELDSATRIGNIFRKLAYQGNENLTQTAEALDKVESYPEYMSTDTSTCSTSLNVIVSGKSSVCKQDSVKKQSILVVPEIKWQREAANLSEKENFAGGRKSSGETTDSEKEGDRLLSVNKNKKTKKLKGENVEVKPSPQRKSLRERFSSKRKKKTSSEEMNAAQKNTFSQIQNAMRSKLPKTLQTTVRMGLSFDPMTVKERNNKARKCDTLTSMLEGRPRSKSNIVNQILSPKSHRSNTLDNIFTKPSLIVSPPDVDPVLKQEGKQGVFDTLRRLGRRKSTNSNDNTKESLIVPLLFPDIAAIGDVNLPPMHVRKLEKLLGPEFGKCYHTSVKHRSNSVPLIRKNGVNLDANVNLEYGRSLSQFNIRQRKDVRQLFDSDGLFDSDLSSSPPSAYESLTENELSDFEAVVDNEIHMLEEISKKADELETTAQQTEKRFVSETVVFLGRKEQQSKTECKVTANTVDSKIENKVEENGYKDQIERTNDLNAENGIDSFSRSSNLLTTRNNISAISTENNIHTNKKASTHLKLNTTLDDTVETRNIANQIPYRIHPGLVSLKKSTNLKTTQELIAESKVIRERQGLVMDRKISAKSNVFDVSKKPAKEENFNDASRDAIAELDALLLEIETYSRN